MIWGLSRLNDTGCVKDCLGLSKLNDTGCVKDDLGFK